MASTMLPQVMTPSSARSKISQNERTHGKPRTGSTRSRPDTGLSAKSFKLKNANRKEQEIILRREMLREQQPILSKAETATYRHSFKHNLCLDMLQAGFHRTFSELHMLMHKQASAREAAGPDSILWNIPLLETETDKLESIKFYLTEAEEAMREGDLQRVYKNRFALAQYFQGRGDKWLSDHFFQTCLEVSANEEDGQQRLCEALCFVGLAMEENRELFNAVDRFEEYYALSQDKQDWRTENGKVYHTDACDHLTRIYTKISDSLDSDQKVARVEYLLKAYNAAKEGGDESFAGEAAYRLGLAYIKMSDAKTALMYLKMYMETCESRGDDVGIGKACEAIAKAYDSEGKTEESLKYLVQFVAVAEKSGQDMALATACQNLGYIYNSRGDYAEASRYFSKAFSLSQVKGNRPGTESSSVHFGVSHALGMMRGVKKHLTTNGKTPMVRLINWKNQRHEEFTKPFTLPVTASPAPNASASEEQSESTRATAPPPEEDQS